jgi:hypothetical protein
MWIVQALVDGRRLVLAGQRRERGALNAQCCQAQRLVLRITCKQIRFALHVHKFVQNAVHEGVTAGKWAYQAGGPGSATAAG